MEYQIYEKGLTKQEMINRLRNYTIFVYISSKMNIQ